MYIVRNYYTTVTNSKRTKRINKFNLPNIETVLFHSLQQQQQQQQKRLYIT